MRQPHRFAILVGALLALTLAACADDDDGGVRIAGQDGSPIDVTASPTEGPETDATGTPSGDGTAAPTESPAGSPEVTETATPEATETPDATETVVPPATTPSGAGVGSAGGVEGFPYGTADVRRAMEDADVPFEVDDEREPLCPDTSVPETTFQSGDAVWALWVYPDTDARETDWEFDDGELQPQTEDCNPPTGFNYFNANLVAVLVEQGASSPEPVRDAFLSVGAPSVVDD